MKRKLTAYRFPDGQVRVFDADGYEYVRGMNGLGFGPDLTYMSPSSAGKPGFFQQGGTANKVVDFASGIFRKKDGTNTYIGDLISQIVAGKAAPVGSGYATIDPSAPAVPGNPYPVPGVARNPEPEKKNYTPWIIGGSVLAAGIALWWAGSQGKKG